ncbi:hypothetical protein [Pseudoalteromonas rubra]|uniref:hypothetical protein n=1 Tax=Pseudoalteromonas rubra TaxID=43658 RepID=UPI002DB8938A|nr:hypothetical protein [Pseudoalteromonas rubra]MEC4089227.1 hypothetical protein [Pseudoalteromonas rubra]
MNKDNKVGVGSAEALLAMSAEGKRFALLKFRPPVWLNGLISVLAALATAASAQASHSSMWTFVTFVSVGTLIVLVMSWSFYLKGVGIKAKSMASKSQAGVRNIAMAFTSALIVLLGHYFTEQGDWHFAYAAGIMIGLLSFVVLYKLPTGEWISQDKAND